MATESSSTNRNHDDLNGLYKFSRRNFILAINPYISTLAVLHAWFFTLLKTKRIKESFEIALLILIVEIQCFFHKIHETLIQRLDEMEREKINNAVLFRRICFHILCCSLFLILLPMTVLFIIWNNYEISLLTLIATLLCMEFLIKTIINLFIYVQFKRIYLLGNTGNISSVQELLYYSDLDKVTSIQLYKRGFVFICKLILLLIFIYMLFYDKSINVYLHAYMTYVFIGGSIHPEIYKIFIKYTADSRVESLNVFVTNDDNNDVCSIRQQDLKHSEARITVCKHLYHSDCLRKWLRNKIECPMCQCDIELGQMEKSYGEPFRSIFKSLTRIEKEHKKVDRIVDKHLENLNLI